MSFSSRAFSKKLFSEIKIHATFTRKDESKEET
jgi:hypothetical protein